MDDLKLYGKNERQVGTLVILSEFSVKILEWKLFGISECTVLNMSSGKVFSCKGIDLTEYGQTIRGLEKGDG